MERMECLILPRRAGGPRAESVSSTLYLPGFQSLLLKLGQSWQAGIEGVNLGLALSGPRAFFHLIHTERNPVMCRIELGFAFFLSEDIEEIFFVVLRQIPISLCGIWRRLVAFFLNCTPICSMLLEFSEVGKSSVIVPTMNHHLT